MREMIVVAVMAAVLGGGAPDAHAAKPAGEEKTGIKVGEKAPDFKLKNQDGEEVALADLIKKGNVALVFTRSAEW